MRKILKSKTQGLDLVIIDVFSSRALYFAVLSGWLAYHLKINYGLVLHGGNLPSRFHSSKRLSRFLLKNAIFISSPSNYLAHWTNKCFGIKVAVIPNVINDSKNSDSKKQINRLLWVRSLSTIYNPQMAVEVLKLLDARGLDFELVFIGPGDPDVINKVRMLVSQYGLSRKVFFKGRMPRHEWHNFAR